MLLPAPCDGGFSAESSAPGDSLPTEGELINQLGVSRETVRVALRLLDAEGLTATRQGRGGVRIRHPEPERVAWSLVQLLTLTGATWGDLLSFRKMLEPAAAALVAEHASPDERAAIAQVAAGGIAPDGTGYYEFHELLVRGAETRSSQQFSPPSNKPCAGPRPSRISLTTTATKLPDRIARLPKPSPRETHVKQKTGCASTWTPPYATSKRPNCSPHR